MDSLLRYKDSRNNSWLMIENYGISELPVQVLQLCKTMSIVAYSYKKGFGLIYEHNLQAYAENNDGFCTIINGHYILFYNQEIQPIGRLRFTVMHEIGHIVNGDLNNNNVACRNKVTLFNVGETTPNNPIDTQANIFASRTLAPSCVLWALDIHKPDEIMDLCGLSYTASKVRAERMAKLYERDAFFTSEREIRAFTQFLGFICETTGKDRKYWTVRMEELRRKNQEKY